MMLPSIHSQDENNFLHHLMEGSKSSQLYERNHTVEHYNYPRFSTITCVKFYINIQGKCWFVKQSLNFWSFLMKINAVKHTIWYHWNQLYNYAHIYTLSNRVTTFLKCKWDTSIKKDNLNTDKSLHYTNIVLYRLYV